MITENRAEIREKKAGMRKSKDRPGPRKIKLVMGVSK
jgi:hypothetical protein